LICKTSFIVTVEVPLTIVELTLPVGVPVILKFDIVCMHAAKYHPFLLYEMQH